MHVDLGDLPTWLAAIFGGAAALVVSWQLGILVRDRRRDQASKFSMWSEYSTDRKEMRVLHSNTSAAPVYDVHSTFSVGDDGMATPFDRGSLGPTSEPVAWTVGWRVIEAEIDRQLRVEFGGQVDHKDRYGNDNPRADVALRRVDLYSNVKIEVVFRDAHGVTWRRESNGKLVKLQGLRHWLSVHKSKLLDHRSGDDR